MKKLIIYHFLFLLSIFSLLSSGVIDSQDGFQYLAVARNIYYTGKPTAPIYEYNQRKNIHMSTYIGKDGKTYSPTGLGYSLAMLPAVAITDIVYKIYNISPPVHFPLENDWLILFTASFTNAFFGALLGVILFIYLLELSISKKQALFISFAGLFATNLFVYSKHSWPHMMFTVFLVLTFLLIKIFSDSKQKKLLYFAGTSFGIMSITYNQTFFLTIPALILYYYILIKPTLKLEGLRTILTHFTLFFLGLIPFMLVYIWFEEMRQGLTNLNQTSISFLASYASNHLRTTPLSILIEGLFGQLFSPGRSVFIYSPTLLIIIFFWHKIRKIVFPELIVFLTLLATYIYFYSTQFSIGAPDQGITGLWHGESSWGPRYLSPLIPFGMLIVGFIYQYLSKKAKLFTFLPLVLFGLYVEILGVLVPYQTKLFNLQEKFFLNGTEYYSIVYSNLLPRYTPIITMSKNLVKLVQNFPKTLDHEIYNVKFYDGIDFPFNVGPERWRVIEGKGTIFFDNYNKKPVKDLAFGMINHPLSESSESAKVQFVLNDHPLLEEPFILTIAERQIIKIPIDEDLIKPRNNRLVIEVTDDNSHILKSGKQILGLQFFNINSQRVNLESLDVPYVSSLGPALMDVEYMNWGGTNIDPWKTWHIHTQIYERVPDFWWVKNLYYWDIPKMPIFLLLAVIISLSIYSGFKTFRLVSK